jgi:hypothetical protein
MKIGKYDLKYKTEHLDGKGIFGDFLKSQDSESAPDGKGLTWSIVTTGPYIEGLRSVSLFLLFFIVPDKSQRSSS